MLEYLENEEVHLVENSDFVLGEHRLEEVARQSRPMSGSPDTEVFRITFMLEYLENEEVHLVENTDFVSREHETRRGGTTKSADERIS